MEMKTLKNILEIDPSPEKLKEELEDVEKLAKALEEITVNRQRKMDFSLGRLKGTIEHHLSCHSLDPERIIIRITGIWNYHHMSGGYDENYVLPGYEQVWMASIPDNEGNFADEDYWFYGWRKEILTEKTENRVA